MICQIILSLTTIYITTVIILVISFFTGLCLTIKEHKENRKLENIKSKPNNDDSIIITIIEE